MFFPRLIRYGKIDLLFKRVHPRDKDLNLVADFISPVAALTNQPALHGVEPIEIVAQRRNMNNSGDERIRQFDNQTVISNVHDRGAKNLWVPFFELLLEELKLLQPDRLNLRVGRVSLRGRNVIGHRFDLSDVDF
jgi:hypothetical protein